MTDVLLVGIDIGTSAVKVAVVDAGGRELAHASADTPWTTVPTGAETTPEELRGAALAAVTAALAEAPAGPVIGVGVTGMAESGTLIDRYGRPLAPIIAWHDRRGEQEAERLGRELGVERFCGTTGLPVSATPTVMKLASLLRERDVAAEARGWLGVPEGLVRSLGGAAIADLSLACRTGLLDLERRSWWPEAVDWLGAPRLALCDPVPSGTPVGTIGVGQGVSERLHGAVLTVAGHDHLTAAFGSGATADGDVVDSSGTAEAVLWATRPLGPGSLSRAVADGLSVSWHVVPGLQVMIGTAPTGLFLGTVLERLECTTADDREALERAAARLPSTSFSHGAGLDPDAVMTGLESGWGPEHTWRAATESATSELGHLLTAVQRHGGRLRRLIATGGWTRSEALVGAKLRLVGRVAVPQLTEAGARGAALMAGVAGGLYPTPYDAPPPAYTVMDNADSTTQARQQADVCTPAPKECSS